MRGDMEISRTGTAQQIADISRINPTLSERQSSPAFISDNGVKANKANEEGANFLLISNPFGPSTCGEVPGMNLQAQPPSLKFWMLVSRLLLNRGVVPVLELLRKLDIDEPFELITPARIEDAAPPAEDEASSSETVSDEDEPEVGP